MRGNSIKYLRVPEEVIDMVNEEDLEKERTCVWLAVALRVPPLHACV